MRPHPAAPEQSAHDEAAYTYLYTSTTPWVLIWAFSTLLWSIFTPPQWTFAARVLLLQPLWLLRAIFSDATWTQDLLLFQILHAVHTNWTGAWVLPNLNALSKVKLDDETLQMYIRLFTLLGGFGLLAGVIVFRGRQLSEASDKQSGSANRIDENPLPALLIPSKTTHSRLIPRKHSFTYSYLLVGVPVGASGRFGSALSIEYDRKCWFDVQSAGYLARSSASQTLAAKLRSYLHSQGVPELEWSFAYLVTAPRFLGYSFNPVSFWYVYDSDIVLRFMVLEVNNTFDERRMYLLRSKGEGAGPMEGVEGDDSASQVKTISFSEVWDKDFHVSPFNDRSGSYSLRAIDPLAALEEKGHVKIDNTIVLRSSKEQAKVVARVYSEGAPSEPTGIDTLALINFILRWWWVGLMTFPRIVWQAQKLYFSKKLEVYYRPEVTRSSLGRNFSDDEIVLETCFRDFIADVVASSKQPLCMIYEPPHHDDAEIAFYSPGFTYQEDKQQTLTLKILTPAFFSRFVHYAHAKEAFDRECLATDEKNRTALVEPTKLLPALLSAIQQARQGCKTTQPALFESLRWKLMTQLRCPPATPSYPSQTEDPRYKIRDIRVFASSELDEYVRTTGDDADDYRRVVTKLFVAQRVGLGLPIVVSALDLLLRAGMLLLAMGYIDHADHFDVFRPRPHTRHDILPVLMMLTLANAIHLWSFAKG